MNKKLYRQLFSSTTWSALLLAAGAFLCAIIIQGFVVTWDDSRRPLFDAGAAATAAEPQPLPPTRYVAPAEIEYPFF